VLGAGIVLAVWLDGAGEHRTLAGRRASGVPTQLTAAPLADLGRAVRTTLSEVDRRLRSKTRRAAAPAKHTRHRVMRRPRHSPPRAASPPHQTSGHEAPPPAVSSPSTATTQSHTYTPVQAPVTTTSQSSATAQPSSSSSSHAAGPTNPGPLGGIGSCVKGCT
jgi:hypothetical protein